MPTLSSNKSAVATSPVFNSQPQVSTRWEWHNGGVDRAADNQRQLQERRYWRLRVQRFVIRHLLFDAESRSGGSLVPNRKTPKTTQCRLLSTNHCDCGQDRLCEQGNRAQATSKIFSEDSVSRICFERMIHPFWPKDASTVDHLKGSMC